MILADGTRLYRPKRITPDNLDDYIDRSGECWLWNGYRDKLGYGYVQLNGRVAPAYRVVYEMLVGTIPSGNHLHHECRTPPCVNPDHLEPLTPTEHAARHAAEITHCKNGHEFTPGNTYVHPTRGTRSCRECHRVASREFARRSRAAAA